MATEVAPVANNDSFYTVNEGEVLNTKSGLYAGDPSVLDNDTDANHGDKLSAILVGTSLNFNPLFSFSSDGNFIFDARNPAYNYLSVGESLVQTFTYQASDGQLLSNIATVTITIYGTNDPPVAVDDSASTTTGHAVTIDVLANDTDVDEFDQGHLKIFSFDGISADGGTITRNAGADGIPNTSDDKLTYTPAAGYFGVDTFNYTVTDLNGATDTATVTVTVTPVNSAPLAVNDDSYSTDENTPLSVVAAGVLSNDTDPNGDTLSAQLVSGANKGSLTSFNPDGSFTYDPAGLFESLGAGQHEDVTFTYKASDGVNFSNVATVTIHVTGVNDGPAAFADVASATEAGGVANGTPGFNPSGNVLTNDTDVDSGDTKAVQGVAAGALSGPLSSNVASAVAGSYGSVTIAADGNYTYTVDNANTAVQALRTSAQVLTDTFTYTMKDTAGATSTTTLTVTVHGANDAPVAVADAASATEAGGVANGTAGVNPTGNVLTNDTDVDSVANGETKLVQGVDAGALAGPLSSNVGSAVAGSYGSVMIAADGSYTYTVDNSKAAVQALLTAANTLTDTFSYTMHDTAGATSTTTLTVTIHGANDAPTAVADAASATEASGVANGTLGVDPTGNVLTNDTDVDSGDTKIVQGVAAGVLSGPLSSNVASVVAGSFGSVTIAADGSYTYTVDNTNATVDALNTGGVLLDKFSYTMHDTAGVASTAVLTVTIHGANDAPHAVDDTNYAKSNSTVPNPDASGNVLQNHDHTNSVGVVFADHADTDVDSASLYVTGIRTGGVEGSGTAGTVGSALTGAHGSLTVNQDGSYSYTVNDADPALSTLLAGQSIDDTFNYTVSDATSGGASDIATLTISVFASIVAPTLADRLFINEIDLGADDVTHMAHSSAIEIINNYNNALGTSDLAAGIVQIRSNGAVHTVDLGKLVGLTCDANGNLLSGSALPGNSILVLYEPSGDHPGGGWSVFGGSTVKSGTFYSTNQEQWDLGTTVHDPLAVNLAQGGSSIDLFAANGASLAGLTGVGSLGNGNHDLGSTAKVGFLAPPGRAGAAWWGGAESTADQSTMTNDVKALLAANNNEYNGSLGGPIDNVFAREYDRYLVSNKGSSVDTQFIDENDSGDWTYNHTGTLGVKNNSTATNSQDATDNVNPSQGTNVHGTSTPSIPNADGQTVYWIGNAGGTLNGGNGPDFLYGGNGADSLLGGSNNDFLAGSGGNDNLTGGPGADRFVFSTTPGVGNVDTIADFSEVQHDMIVLSRTIFAGLTAGSTVPAVDFVANGAPAPADASDHILYNTSTGALYYDSDGVGGAAAIQFATLTGHPTLSAADFSIIA